MNHYFNYLSDPYSFYSASSDSEPEEENSLAISQPNYYGSISVVDDLISWSRRARDYLCRHKWILKSLDMGMKREFTLWWNKNYIRQEPPAGSLNGLDTIHDPYQDLDGDQLGTLIRNAPGTIPRISGSIARICRTELYISDRPTEAEIIVIREWLVRHMNSRHIRKNVQSAILPFALKFSLIPTRDELSARELTLQPEYQERLRSQQPIYSRGRKWLFNWLGRKIYEPVVRQA